MRSNMASWRIERTDGKKTFAVAPLPHAENVARPISCAGDLLRRRRVVLTQLGKGARPQLGRVTIQVVPATAGHGGE
jgi:hypothetical protein